MKDSYLICADKYKYYIYKNNDHKPSLVYYFMSGTLWCHSMYDNILLFIADTMFNARARARYTMYGFDSYRAHTSTDKYKGIDE